MGEFFYERGDLRWQSVQGAGIGFDIFAV